MRDEFLVFRWDARQKNDVTCAWVPGGETCHTVRAVYEERPPWSSFGVYMAVLKIYMTHRHMVAVDGRWMAGSAESRASLVDIEALPPQAPQPETTRRTVGKREGHG